MAGRLLDQEALRCEAQVKRVLYVERKFEDVISLGGSEVRLNYRVDRVDEMMDGSILILDYKTGGIDQSPKDIFLLEGLGLSRELIRDYVRSFQMPLYVHYLQKEFPGCPVNSTLYHLRTMAFERFLKEGQMEDAPKILEAYLKALDFIMAEIFNLKIPFVDDPVHIK